MDLFLLNVARNIKGDIVSESNAKLASHGLIATGFLSSGSNPQFFLWWLTIGIPIMAVALSSAGIAGFIVFLIGHAAADLLWFGFISSSVEKGRNYLSQKAVKIILMGSAVLLLLFGFYLLLSAGSLRFIWTAEKGFFISLGQKRQECPIIELCGYGSKRIKIF